MTLIAGATHLRDRVRPGRRTAGERERAGTDGRPDERERRDHRQGRLVLDQPAELRATYRVSVSSYRPPAIVRTFYAADARGDAPRARPRRSCWPTEEPSRASTCTPGAKGSAPATLVATAAHPPVLGEPFTIDVTVTGDHGVPTGSVWVGTSLVGEVSYADAALDAAGHATLTFDAIDQRHLPLGRRELRRGRHLRHGGRPWSTTSSERPHRPSPPSPPRRARSSAVSRSTITGTGFGADSTVTFGGVAATVAVEGPTTLVATAPAHAAGPVDVVVTDAGPGERAGHLHLREGRDEPGAGRPGGLDGRRSSRRVHRDRHQQRRRRPAPCRSSSTVAHPSPSRWSAERPR